MSQNIITLGAVVGALLTVLGVFGAVGRFVLSVRDKARIQRERNQAQDQDIAHLKQENQLMCYGLIAALDGLEQLGANHIVPQAKSKLEKYLNQQAHK